MPRYTTEKNTPTNIPPAANSRVFIIESTVRNSYLTRAGCANGDEHPGGMRRERRNVAGAVREASASRVEYSNVACLPRRSIRRAKAPVQIAKVRVGSGARVRHPGAPPATAPADAARHQRPNQREAFVFAGVAGSRKRDRNAGPSIPPKTREKMRVVIQSALVQVRPVNEIMIATANGTTAAIPRTIDPTSQRCSGNMMATIRPAAGIPIR